MDEKAGEDLVALAKQERMPLIQIDGQQASSLDLGFKVDV